MTGKGRRNVVCVYVADVAASVLASVDRVSECDIPIRSDRMAAQATALMATPAANLCRRARAQSGHDILRAFAHSAIRLSTTRRKPASAFTCHPSSGHAGGNNQSSANGDGTLGRTRARIRWAGTCAGTARPMRRRADVSPDFRRAGTS